MKLSGKSSNCPLPFGLRAGSLQRVRPKASIFTLCARSLSAWLTPTLSKRSRVGSCSNGATSDHAADNNTSDNRPYPLSRIAPICRGAIRRCKSFGGRQACGRSFRPKARRRRYAPSTDNAWGNPGSIGDNDAGPPSCRWAEIHSVHARSRLDGFSCPSEASDLKYWPQQQTPRPGRFQTKSRLHREQTSDKST